MSGNKENRRMVKVDVKLEHAEEINTGYELQLQHNQPYTYDPIKKQIVCSPGTTFVDMKELKDSSNRGEDRMKTVDKGISRVSSKNFFKFSKITIIKTLQLKLKFR